MRPVVYVDVDGVVCDILTPWFARYNQDYGATLTPEGSTRYDLADIVHPDCGTKIYDYLDATIYDDAVPYPGATTGVAALERLGVRVVYATSTGRGIADAKRAWLERFGFLSNDETAHNKPHDDLVYIHDKGLLHGAALIDDYAKNLRTWDRHGVLLRRPWSEPDRAPGVFVAETWDQAVYRVEQIVNETVVEEAQRIVYGGRMDEYGHPYDNDSRIAALWSTLFGWDVAETDIWQAMVCVKLSRERTKPKRDNRTDVVGYAATGQLVNERSAEVREKMRQAMERLQRDRPSGRVPV